MIATIKLKELAHADECVRACIDAGGWQRRMRRFNPYVYINNEGPRLKASAFVLEGKYEGKPRRPCWQLRRSFWFGEETTITGLVDGIESAMRAFQNRVLGVLMWDGAGI